MIYLYTGKPGSGKTYILALKAYQFLKAGLQVYSNFWLNYQGPNLHYFKSLKDIENVRNGIILLDEAQIYLNARLWDVLDPAFQYLLQQHRKQGLHIYATSQSINRIDVVMRELVNYYFEVYKIGTSEKKDGTLPRFPFGIFLVLQYQPTDAGKKKRDLLGLEIYFMSKKILNFYDTLKTIDAAQSNPNDLYHRFYAKCPSCGSFRAVSGYERYKIPSSNENEL